VRLGSGDGASIRHRTSLSEKRTTRSRRYGEERARRSNRLSVRLDKRTDNHRTMLRIASSML
jgi:hypothetical protein